jgi:hypothetical protein
MVTNYFKQLPTALPPGPRPLALAPFRPQAEHVVGLFRDEIAKVVQQRVEQQPTDGLFADAQTNQQLAAYRQAAGEVYDRYFDGKLWEVQRDDFISCVQQSLFELLYQVDEKEQLPQSAVFTRNGIAFLDQSVIDASQMRTQMEGEQRAIAQQKKAIDRAYRTKVTKLFHERENELMRNRYPDITEQQLSDRHKIIKSIHFSTVQKKRETYIQEHPLTDQKEWLRTFATWMFRDKIKFAERTDFLIMTRHALHVWKIDVREVEHARKLIHHRGQLVMHLASKPRDQFFSPQELDDREVYFNQKYQHLATQGRTYCAELYHRVRTIQQYGMSAQQVHYVTTQLDIYAPTSLTHTSSEPDLFPHEKRVKKTVRASFVEAVTRVIEAHPHRYEQDVLWKLFFRYNYRHKHIKPLPAELHPQAEAGYRKRKQREREEKTKDTTPPALWPDLFQGETLFSDELIDFLAGRISRVGK